MPCESHARPPCLIRPRSTQARHVSCSDSTDLISRAAVGDESAAELLLGVITPCATHTVRASWCEELRDAFKATAEHTLCALPAALPGTCPPLCLAKLTRGRSYPDISHCAFCDYQSSPADTAAHMVYWHGWAELALHVHGGIDHVFEAFAQAM